MRRHLLMALLIALVVSVSTAHAATREQAVQRALAADGRGARVLEVRRSDDGDTWQVKVITDGRVRVHRIPAD